MTTTPRPGRVRCAVLGSPIGHSKSPALHRAAYGVLGLDWSYDAIDLVGPALPAFLDALGEEWRGLSLTMPLKRDVLPLLDWADPIARLTGGANTVLLAGTGAERTRRGYNTDVRGIDQAFRDAGVTSLGTVHLIGGGATAASALAAVAGLGASRAVVSVRTPARAEDLIQVGEQLGVAVTVRDWTEQSRVLAVPDAVISTLPGGYPSRSRSRGRSAPRPCCSMWPTSRGRARSRSRGATRGARSSAGSTCSFIRPSRSCASS